MPADYHEPTDKQLKYIRDLGGKLPDGSSRDDASDLIRDLLSANPDKVTPRQKMVLRFFGKTLPDHWTRDDASEWLNRFYEGNPNRRIAWSEYKLYVGDDGSSTDPDSIEFGIGQPMVKALDSEHLDEQPDVEYGNGESSRLDERKDEHTAGQGRVGGLEINLDFGKPASHLQKSELYPAYAEYLRNNNLTEEEDQDKYRKRRAAELAAERSAARGAGAPKEYTNIDEYVKSKNGNASGCGCLAILAVIILTGTTISFI